MKISDELRERINHMDEDELISFENAIVVFQYFISILGISSILVVLNFMNIFSVLVGIFIVYFLSNLSVSMKHTKDYIYEKLGGSENR